MSANRRTTGSKRKPPKTAWHKGQSGNPGGRPKDGESWASVIKAVSDMNVDEILAFIGTASALGKKIGRLPRGVQVKYLVTARVFAELMSAPTAGLWTGLMDRAEGKVREQIQIDGILNVENLIGTLNKVYGTGNDNRGK